jgi:hypothetical protein
VIASSFIVGCSRETKHISSANAVKTKYAVDGTESGTPDGLTHLQVISTIVKPPFVQGYVLGKVGQGRPVAADAGGVAEQFTEFPMQVLRFFGPAPAPYQAGATIALRVPGGSASEGTPVVHDGDTVIALVRDQGAQGGGNTATRVVVTIPGQDLLSVDPATQTVTGQAGWSDLKLSLSDFAAAVAKNTP